MISRLVMLGAVCAAVLVLDGCTTPPASDRKGDKAGPKKEEEQHVHGAGPHGGAVADWKQEGKTKVKYHVEFTVDHKKQQATVHVLGSDEKTPAPIKAGKLLIKFKEPAFELELKPEPEKTDPQGTSSRFVGTNKRLGKEQEFEGDVTGTVDGKTCTGHFKEEPDEKK